MNTFAVFRSVAFELVHHPSQTTSWLSRSRHTSPLRTTFVLPHIYHRLFHPSPRRKWTKNIDLVPKAAINEERAAKQRRRKEIGLRDAQIPYNKVQLITGRALSPYQPLSDVLAEVDRLNAMEGKKRYNLKLIGNEQGPIVRIIDMKEEYEKTKAAQEHARANAAQNVHKEMQLTWSSSEADVKTKMERVKKDLGKGYRVDWVVTPKKATRAPPLPEMQSRAQEIVAQFAGVAKEWKPPSIVRGTVVVYLQGTVLPTVPGVEAEEEKVPRRIQVRLERKERAAKRLEEKVQRENELFGTLESRSELPL